MSAQHAMVRYMGIFNRRSHKEVRQQDPVVGVVFRDIAAKDPLANFSPEHAYAYIWPFPEKPQVGDWAVAPGWDGPASVIVGSLGLPKSARGETLRPLLKRILPEEVARVRAKRDSAVDLWLDYARDLVGLPSSSSPPTGLPSGFDPLPPAQGTADAETAGEYGRVWWRAHKLAIEQGRPAEEVAAFKAAGEGWFKLRDQSLKNERDQRISRAATATDLEAAIRNVGSRPRAEVEKMVFAGQPLWDWLAYAQDLEREGSLEEALNLLQALIVAAEQEAKISGREPAPAYTERAAIIHRKRRDYAAEIAVIERWERACPPEKRGPGATQAKLLKRLQRARELEQKN